MCLFSALRKNLEKAAVAVVEAVKSAAEDHRTVCRSSRLLLLVSAWRPSGRYVAGIDHFSPFFLSFFSLSPIAPSIEKTYRYGFLFYS